MSGRPLDRLKARTEQRRRTGDTAADAATRDKHSAAQSHVQNDQYMNDFDAAWKDMHGLSIAASNSERGQDLASSGSYEPGQYSCTLPARAADGWVSGPIDTAGELPTPPHRSDDNVGMGIASAWIQSAWTTSQFLSRSVPSCSVRALYNHTTPSLLHKQRYEVLSAVLSQKPV